MRAHVQQNLAKMRAQERQLEQLVLTLEKQIAETREQLLLTRGAVQVLQHVLETVPEADEVPVSDPSMEEKQHATN